MLNDRVNYQTATTLVRKLANGRITSTELVENAISRINTLDKEINAIVFKDFDRARIAAKEADEALARGKRLPLLGLPITVKESFHVVGTTSTWGNPAFKHWQPKQDGLVISRLKSAGAIILGKTNVPFMLGDWQSYNDLYGPTNNPWNLHLTPGGSSGGSAAALAMGYVSLELGSDLAGSLRVPAHFCGVCTHKPSVDLIPMRGSGPPTRRVSTTKIDLATSGPMARSAADLALALDVLAGPDELSDGVAYKLNLPKPQKKRLNDFRVLMLDEHPLYPTAKDVLQVHHRLYDDLIGAGVQVVRSHPSMPSLEKIACHYALILAAWYSINLPEEEFVKTQEELKQFSAADNSLAANFTRGILINHRDWLRASLVREQLRDEWRAIYREFDLVLCPVMPTAAFPHDFEPDHDLRRFEIDGIPVSYSHMYIWCSIATLFGLPATVTPVGLTAQGLPVGIQIIGDYLQDKFTIEFANLLEKHLGGQFIPPRYQ